MTISVERIQQIFQAADKTRIAVFGDLMLDVYLCGSASRLSQEAPVPVLHVKQKSTRLGGAANVMRNLASFSRCGIHAFGVVGNDAQGEVLKQLLASDGIDVAGVLADPTRRTTEKQRVIAGNQQLVRMDFEDTHPVSADTLRPMADHLKKLILAGELDAIIFEDYAKGLLEKEIMQELADLAAEHGVFTSLDPHPGHAMNVKNLSLMTPNRSEAFGLAGIYHTEANPVVEDDEALKLVSERIFDFWNPQVLLVTLGHQGMALFDREKRGQNPLVIPTVAREVFDVSGAGDTVIATYTLCMAAGSSPAEAAAIANQAAGVVVGKVGTATCTVAELLDSVRR